MNETLQKIRQETLERLKAAKDESEIESLSVSVLARAVPLRRYSSPWASSARRSVPLWASL